MQGFQQSKQRFRNGQESPRTLLEACLARIDARDGEVQAFCALDADGARRAADQSAARYAAGQPLSSIDGMPVGIKDNIEAKSMPTTIGSEIFAGHDTGRDAAIVHALRRAGAVIVGKTVTTEFAGSVPGPTRNPLDLERTPGGSSSGSAAAVADGMVPVAIGTQVVGSIVRPASFCGVIGFKPTYGALNRGGVDGPYSQNCLGTLSLTLEDAYAVCHEVAIRVGGDPGHLPFLGGPGGEAARRPGALAVLETDGWAKAEEGARQAFEAALGRLRDAGVRLLDRRNSTLVAELEQVLVGCRQVAWELSAWEVQWPFAELLEVHGERISAAMRKRITDGQAMRIDDYRDLLARRDSMSAALERLAPEVDGVVSLAAPGAAPKGINASGDPILNVPFTAMRVPALSLPLLELDGMPLGLQLAGFAGRDRALSAIARWMLENRGSLGSNATPKGAMVA